MKIGIVGLGSVGAAVATHVQATGAAREMVLFDTDAARALSAAEDLGHADAFGHDTVIRSGTYRDFRGCGIIVIAAGANQRPGQTRTDLLHANAAVITDIVSNLRSQITDTNTILIIVTNPLDVMTMLATELSGLPAQRVIGTGTMLDSARLRVILSRHLNVSTASINAYVLGEHGDSSVVNWSSAAIGNIPLADFCAQTNISLTARTRDTIAYRVKNAAYEIIRGRGATWDGIGAAVADLVVCIARDQRRILTTSATTAGFIKSPVAFSVPRIVGANGAVQTLIPPMDAAETRALRASANIIRNNFESLSL